MKPTRGGTREGAGRKPGSGTGRNASSASITLLDRQWERLDAIRGELTRSAWIAGRIDRAKTAPPAPLPPGQK